MTGISGRQRAFYKDAGQSLEQAVSPRHGFGAAVAGWKRLQPNSYMRTDLSA